MQAIPVTLFFFFSRLLCASSRFPSLCISSASHCGHLSFLSFHAHVVTSIYTLTRTLGHGLSYGVFTTDNKIIQKKSLMAQLRISHVPLNVYLKRFELAMEVGCSACGAPYEEMEHFPIRSPICYDAHGKIHLRDPQI